MKRLIIMAGCSATLLFHSCTVTRSVQINALSERETIRLQVGDTYQLLVEENISAGYVWQAERAKDCLIEIRSAFRKNKQPKEMAGIGVEKTYTIYGREAGECTVTFSHIRNGHDVVETKTIHFQVE